MKWVRDRTGRFPERPHYQPEELDGECERLITDFLKSRHGRVAFPVPTDDLTVLIEQAGADLDPYADLSNYEGEVQGLTEFIPGLRARVQTSRGLAENPRYENRYRTTLAHEFCHVHFHSFLWELRLASQDLFAASARKHRLCRRGTMIEAPASDWMEWQAGYGSGALLMPASRLREVIICFLHREQLLRGPFPVNSQDGQHLMREVMTAFGVSEDAARVRLSTAGHLDRRHGRTAELVCLNCSWPLIPASALSQHEPAPPTGNDTGHHRPGPANSMLAHAKSYLGL